MKDVSYFSGCVHALRLTYVASTSSTFVPKLCVVFGIWSKTKPPMQWNDWAYRNVLSHFNWDTFLWTVMQRRRVTFSEFSQDCNCLSKLLPYSWGARLLVAVCWFITPIKGLRKQWYGHISFNCSWHTHSFNTFQFLKKANKTTIFWAIRKKDFKKLYSFYSVKKHRSSTM